MAEKRWKHHYFCLFVFFAADALYLFIRVLKTSSWLAQSLSGCDIISTTHYGLDVTFHQDIVTIIIYQCLLSSPPFEGGLRGVGPFATWPLLLPPRGAAASHPYLRPGTKIFKYMIVREARRVGLRCCCCVSPPRKLVNFLKQRFWLWELIFSKWQWSNIILRWYSDGYNGR